MGQLEGEKQRCDGSPPVMLGVANKCDATKSLSASYLLIMRQIAAKVLSNSEPISDLPWSMSFFADSVEICDSNCQHHVQYDNQASHHSDRSLHTLTLPSSFAISRVSVDNSRATVLSIEPNSPSPMVGADAANTAGRRNLVLGITKDSSANWPSV